MELEFLPATVYRPGLAPRQPLNTIIEEEPGLLRLDDAPAPEKRIGRPPHAVPSNNRRARFRSPLSLECAPSPSSSIGSASLTWSSSESGNTIDTITDIDDSSDPINAGAVGDEAIIEVMLEDLSSDALRIPPRRQRSSDSQKPRPKYPRLLIPSVHRLPGCDGLGKKHSPMPPPPPPKLPESPAMVAFLAQAPAPPSGPPSLDGSPTSEQLAATDTPSTPSVGTPDNLSTDWSDGIRLNDEALATLQLLSKPAELDCLTEVATEQSEPLPSDRASATTRRHTLELSTPVSSRFRSGLGQLEIPSPGGFFDSLGTSARRTWCPPSAQPPSSTTAERFYQCPWEQPASNRIGQQSVQNGREQSPDPKRERKSSLTARHPQMSPVLLRRRKKSEGLGSIDENSPSPQRRKDDEELVSPWSAIDRTNVWLSTQEIYLKSITASSNRAAGKSSSTPAEFAMLDFSHGFEPLTFPEPILSGADILSPESCVAVGIAEPESVADPVFMSAFSKLVNAGSGMDAFVHCQPRFDAVQTRRICSPAAHLREVHGQYQAPVVKPYRNHFETEPSAEQVAGTQRERERRATMQVLHAHWAVMALKFLNGGMLLTHPSTQRLTTAALVRQSDADAARVLDLAGEPVCGWGWHCANEYATAEVHTLSVDARAPSSPSPFPGPDNHYQLSAPHLSKLPFPDNHFDVVSTRSAHMFLKSEKAPEEQADEYDRCLAECWRCLKPGGYLEFFLFDSELMDAGPLGTAMSVEFSFKLKTRGYDPSPTRSWLGRLAKAGFSDVQRMWLFLSMGAPYRSAAKPAVPPHGIGTENSSSASGTAADFVLAGTQSIDAIPGLVGLRAWEQWMLRLQTEIGSGEGKLLEEVCAVVEEGAKHRAGWRCLRGRARKPMRP